MRGFSCIARGVTAMSTLYEWSVPRTANKYPDLGVALVGVQCQVRAPWLAIGQTDLQANELTMLPSLSTLLHGIARNPLVRSVAVVTANLAVLAAAEVLKGHGEAIPPRWPCSLVDACLVLDVFTSARGLIRRRDVK